MKKIIYTFLALAVGFSSCKKEEDEVTPTNYSVEGVWETTYANLDGTNVLTPYSHVYEFFWEDGTYGGESYDFDGNIAVLSIGSYSISSDKTSLTINIEYVDDDGDNDAGDDDETAMTATPCRYSSVSLLRCQKKVPIDPLKRL